MKRITLAFALLAVISLSIGKDILSHSKEPPRATATFDDSTSIGNIIKAVYDVISGPAGQARDWKRFRSLFVPGAHLIHTSPGSGGTIQITVLTPEDYIERYGQALEKNGFFEQEVARRTEQFAHIAEVFTTYESRHQQREKPFARGINSMQLMNDGQRWWIVSIMWDAERPGSELPEKYLHSGK
jgi:hypothetical protein